MEISGENLYSCYQCGKCSAGCPSVDFMDLNPREVIRMIIEGHEEVLNSQSPWVCAACFTCSVRCPNEIDVSRIMEALRQMRLRRKHDAIRISEIPSEELMELPQIALISCFRKMTG
ncbi:MAG: 4Fe-4S dicluster domain-containing protein [Archaeoglobi archaeon]|nr:4Fe-4S dicluster domain-containing protein [Candidatus Mnemosynella sp.]MBC7115156.1 4Fe-4S dicluster domain-containing protein [Candidatus Mnemosynella bozhongmuii]